MIVLSIDPGPTQSAYTAIDLETRKPVVFAKVDNAVLLDLLAEWPERELDHVAIEMIASYGMSVGAEVFDTCVWIGRFYQVVASTRSAPPELVFRREVKLHHCLSPRATDANITQALIDRFAYGVPNRGKGSKSAPGWFYGFAGDVWQAYALGVYVADLVVERTT